MARPKLVAASDVLRTNARTSAAFDGVVIGRYVAGGPNAWDGFHLEPVAEHPIRVFPGIKVQLETAGTVIRMRARGTVVRVAWVPPPDLSGASPPGLRAAFVDRCVRGLREAAAIGAQAAIASRLLR